MLQRTGERQVGTELAEIRLDHRSRYEWVKTNINSGQRLLDVGCGVGYGSNIIADHCNKVHAIDIDEESIEFARKYWSRYNIKFEVMDACCLSFAEDTKFDVATIFEVVEHLIAPELFLSALHGVLTDSAVLFVSVPNEEVIAHTIELNPFHIRHYAPANLGSLLKGAGFEIEEIFSQDEADVSPGAQGRTLIVRCRRSLGVVAKVELTDWPVALNNAAREIVDRGKVIRKLQKTIQKYARQSDQFNATFDAVKRQDASYQAEIKNMFDELGMLGQELLAVKAANESLEVMRVESEYALVRASNVLAIQNDELKKQNEKLKVYAAKDIELRALLAAQASELAKEKRSIKALRDEKSLNKKFFNPDNPKIGSLIRLTLRHRFFIPILIMAPLNSAYGLYKKYIRISSKT